MKMAIAPVLFFIQLSISSGIEVCLNGSAVGYCSNGWHCCTNGYCCPDGFICSYNNHCYYIRASLIPGLCAVLCVLCFISIVLYTSKKHWDSRKL
ncbi:uncharacterized protein LOC127737966 [Mytilus californianus]|uniref:uncharacterized protein LOC127737966 n=1 Tax=Mytilus californianus TaxID=6549 RepID=UPI002247B905|nr:uncharacterized protein LOC127737966 [Mytilus californianus]